VANAQNAGPDASQPVFDPFAMMEPQEVADKIPSKQNKEKKEQKSNVVFF
jgi:hypothetical protein